MVIGNGPRGVIIGNGSTLILRGDRDGPQDFIDALRGIVGVGPTTLCGEVNSGIHACETVPGRVITIIVESALIGYVRIWIIMVVEKEMLNVYLLSVFWYMRILYMCMWYVYFVLYSFVYVYVW